MIYVQFSGKNVDYKNNYSGPNLDFSLEFDI